ncbi:ABC transporter permease [Paraburkholderia sp.]|uniref:ABC transporter permease n=1 Tax=Paraburkholderia sp. TaxID=1926495 RepID=UPI0039E527F9
MLLEQVRTFDKRWKLRLSDKYRNSLSLLICRIGVLFLIVAAWEAFVDLRWMDRYLFSSPSKIIARFGTLISSGALFEHIYVTAAETFLAFVIGAVAGVVLGILLALLPRVARILDPFLVAINGLPRAALAPLFVVWFGIGIASKVAVGASIVLFVCLLSTYDGVANANAVLLQVGRSLGATPYQLLTKVQLPSALPWIVGGLRTSVAMSLIGTIIGEFIAASHGLGWYIAYSAGIFDTTGVMVGLIVLGLIAVLLDISVQFIGRRLTPWKANVTP